MLVPRLYGVDRELKNWSLGVSFQQAGADMVIDGAGGAAKGTIAAGSVDTGAAALLGVGRGRSRIAQMAASAVRTLNHRRRPSGPRNPHQGSTESRTDCHPSAVG
jgi:shikimate 5-dehydrogenase